MREMAIEAENKKIQAELEAARRKQAELEAENKRKQAELVAERRKTNFNPALVMAKKAKENALLAANLLERDKKKLEGKSTDGTWTYVYLGELKDDKPEGLGVRTWSHGEKYEGTWKVGKQHGQGVCRYPSGQIYEGSWENDNYHGRGKMTYSDGRVEDGLWRDDIFQG